MAQRHLVGLARPSIFVLLMLLMLPSLTWAAAPLLLKSPSLVPPESLSAAAWIDGLQYADAPKELKVLDPALGALLPSDAASPLIRWKDAGSGPWLVTLTVAHKPVCQALLDTTSWSPDPVTWDALKLVAHHEIIRVTINAIGSDSTLLSRGETAFAVSTDPVGAQIAFLRKRLPFKLAKDHPYDSQMVVGDVAAFSRPRIVLEDQPICFNCHAYSPDGSAYGMDMDYKGDKGGYALVQPSATVSVSDGDVISWNDYKAPAPSKYSMGLFTTFSPNGRYAASTVGESSAFVMLDDVFFSQMFYPATGQIALYDRDKGKVFPLPGADDLSFIQTNPAFSADGRRVAFARALVKPSILKAIETNSMRNEDPTQTILEVNEKYPMQFSLYTVPFNEGRGGEAQPIAGASNNGLSNFFPKYSPDGKWLVFTQCKTGLVLQPDSRLVIVPAEGGTPRMLTANTPLMNSWHSWSPNSRWLAFASKGNSPFTEIYLTHIDETGNSSPAIRLYRFSDPEMAAMVPEFIPVGTSPQHTMALADPEGAKGESMATDGR